MNVVQASLLFWVISRSSPQWSGLQSVGADKVLLLNVNEARDAVPFSQVILPSVPSGAFIKQTSFSTVSELGSRSPPNICRKAPKLAAATVSPLSNIKSTLLG